MVKSSLKLPAVSSARVTLPSGSFNFIPTPADKASAASWIEACKNPRSMPRSRSKRLRSTSTLNWSNSKNTASEILTVESNILFKSIPKASLTRTSAAILTCADTSAFSPMSSSADPKSNGITISGVKSKPAWNRSSGFPSLYSSEAPRADPSILLPVSSITTSSNPLKLGKPPLSSHSWK